MRNKLDPVHAGLRAHGSSDCSAASTGMTASASGECSPRGTLYALRPSRSRSGFRFPSSMLRKRVDQGVVWRGHRERLTRHWPHTVGARGCKPYRIPHNATKISCLNSMLRSVVCGGSWHDAPTCAKRRDGRPPGVLWRRDGGRCARRFGIAAGQFGAEAARSCQLATRGGAPARGHRHCTPD